VVVYATTDTHQVPQAGIVARVESACEQGAHLVVMKPNRRYIEDQNIRSSRLVALATSRFAGESLADGCGRKREAACSGVRG